MTSPRSPRQDSGSGASPSAGRPVDPTPVELGRRIKLMRVSRGLTLKDLEERGGISATHVSEIERGKASPTIGALTRIAHALDVRPAVLVRPRALPEFAVTRAGERASRRVRWGDASLEPVADPVHGGTLGAHILTLPIGREAALVHHHEGEEWITVMEGAVEIRVRDEVHSLREGDTLHFRAEHAHAYSNPTSRPAVLLIACRPALSI
jgi:transcriptional regulator with XRE-family HTH domain